MNPNAARLTRCVLAAASLLAMLTCLGAAPPAKRPEAPAVDGFARTIRKVTDHVWLVERPVPTDAPFEGNVEVIEQADGLVVVDAGGAPPAGRHIARLIRSVSAKPVKAIVYTHYHGDHNLGAGELLKAWPRAAVISTQKTRDNMRGKPMAYIQTYARSYGDMAGYAKQQAAIAQVGPLAKEGRTLEETRRAVKLESLKDRFAGDDAWKRFLMSAVFLGDVVKNAWQEARGDSIVQGGS